MVMLTTQDKYPERSVLGRKYVGGNNEAERACENEMMPSIPSKLAVQPTGFLNLSVFLVVIKSSSTAAEKKVRLVHSRCTAFRYIERE